MRELFSGPTSLTYRGERLAFWVTLMLALPAAALIGFFIHEELGISQVALFLVIAMLYVTLARGRLVGSSVRIHESQYPQLFAIVKRCAIALELPMPMVFVREDYVVPVIAVGLGEPYSLIVSSTWLEHFRDDEMTFMIGRELGHIASGHTRYTSLLSANGNENPLVSLIFGPFLRRAELTCDRVGLLCCGSLEVAMRAIAIASFSKFGRKIDYARFAEQHRDVMADQVLRWGEWLGAMPYATHRIDAMRWFIDSHIYRLHEEWFLRETGSMDAPALIQAGQAHVAKKDCVGWWRRLGAYAVDLIVVFALVQTISSGVINETVNEKTPPVQTPTHSAGKKTTGAHSASETVRVGGVTIGDSGVSVDQPAQASGFHYSWTKLPEGVRALALPLLMPLYFIVLVIVVGQTPGMLITG
ncbi:MAG: M48 family metallopeptidase, partial [Candidatus Eremiobacteraeota bacterium]|nr:M48 family metallopeptidase [Candidatus Eremiobacteraeota bacterium]